LDEKTEFKFVPRIVITLIERLELLLFSKACRAEEIIGAFYDLDDEELFLTKWSHDQEKELKKYKDRINLGNYEFSEIEDPRFCV